MNRPDFFIAIEDHLDCTLRDFSRHLAQMPKKPVGTVTISELCSVSEYPNGLYFLFDEQGNLGYVGKSTSRSFVERIRSHFDQRPDAWFNTLPKKIVKVAQLAAYADGHAAGLRMGLVLVGVKDKQRALNLETALRGFMSPRFNPCRGSRFTGDERLSSI